jgi:hypothetical protein
MQWHLHNSRRLLPKKPSTKARRFVIYGFLAILVNAEPLWMAM